jgi:hypothetical protein
MSLTKTFLDHCIAHEIVKQTDEGYSIDIEDGKTLFYSRFDNSFTALEFGAIYEHPELTVPIAHENDLITFANGLMKLGCLQPIENGYQLITQEQYAVLDPNGWRAEKMPKNCDATT